MAVVESSAEYWSGADDTSESVSGVPSQRRRGETLNADRQLEGGVLKSMYSRQFKSR